MPEMLGFCGKRYPGQGARTQGLRHRRLAVSADGERVHLEELRCDGSAHGGCQAGCLLYWKEPWLVRLEPQEGAAAAEVEPDRDGHSGP